MSGFPFPTEEGGDAQQEIARIADSLQLEAQNISAPSPKPAPTLPPQVASLPLSLPPQGMSLPTGVVRPPVPDQNQKAKMQLLVKNLKEGKITKEQFSQQLIQTVGKQQAMQIMTKTQILRPQQPSVQPQPPPQPTAGTPKPAPTMQTPQPSVMMVKMQPGKQPPTPGITMRTTAGQPGASSDQMQRTMLQLQLQQQMALSAKLPIPSAEEQKKMMMMYNTMPSRTAPGTVPQGPGASSVGGTTTAAATTMTTTGGQPPAKKARTASAAKKDAQPKGEKEPDKGGAGGGGRPTSLKDLNDVTRIAGVDLKEESNKFLASMPTVGESAEPDQDAVHPLLNRQLLQKRVQAIVAAQGLQTNVGDQVYELLTLAVTERMRDILERLATFAEHRQEKGEGFRTTTTLDPRRQLRNIEKREKEEHERRDEQFSSDLSSKLLGEASEHRRQLQAQEEERSNANATALQAIGNIPTRGRARSTPAAPAAPGAPPAQPPAPQAQPSAQQMMLAMAAMRVKPETLQMMQRLQQMEKDGTINPQQRQQLYQFHTALRKLATSSQIQGAASGAASSTTSKTAVTQVSMQDVAFLFQTDPYLRRKSSRLVLRHPLDNRPGQSLFAQSSGA